MNNNIEKGYDKYWNVNTGSISYGTKYKINLLFQKLISSFIFIGHSLFDFPRRLFLNPFDIDDDDDNKKDSPFANRFAPCDDAVSSTKKKPKAWSVRARRDEPNLLRGDR